MYKTVFKTEITLREAVSNLLNEVKEKRKNTITDGVGQTLGAAVVNAYNQMYGKALTDEHITGEIWHWYRKTYTGKSKKGLHRDPEDFHLPISENPWRDYLYNNVRPTAIIIMHVAVAFKMSPDKLDSLLCAYGYLPLHVRNLHHLAIYAVLSAYNDENSEKEFLDTDPFDTLRDWYFAAVDIVKDSSAYAAKDERKSSLTTTNFIKKRDGFGIVDKETLKAFVKTYKQEFHMRHSKLLAEHLKLATTLGWIYDSYPKGYYWQTDEDALVLRDLVNTYCLGRGAAPENANKHYKDRLVQKIHTSTPQNNFHPTREAMIFLWLFAACYLNSNEITFPKKYTDYICQTPYNAQKYIEAISKTEAPTAINGTKYEGCKFNLGDYLKGNDSTSDFSEKDININTNHFSGEGIKSYINDKLGKYGWSPLSNKSSFDRIIMLFLRFDIVGGKIKLTFEQNTSKQKVTATVTSCDCHCLEKDGHPTLLVLLFAFLKTLLKNDGENPLACTLYEQL